MHNSNHQSINSKNNKNLTQEELIAITEEYPYYSLAHFWLLSNYKKNGHTSFEKEAAVTALFFNNQTWLNWQLHQTNQDEKVDAPVVLAEEPDVANKEKATLADQNRSEELIAFEPLHTVDYFASQGIKIGEEPVSNDKLGTQLKSFTEWLKSMKKVPLQKISEGGEQTDKMIQNIAEGSNANIEVITEAMAEVLLQQEKPEQAIEIYNKLSFSTS